MSAVARWGAATTRYQNGSWGVGCSGSASAGSLALNGTVAVNNSAAGYSGAITYRCETPAGGGSPSLREISRTCNPGPTCSYAVLGLATGATIAWQNGAGSASCSGPLPPPPAPGSSVTVNSTNGNTGTYRATCLPSGSWDPNAVVTCDLPPTTQCNPRAVSWTGADGTQCSGSTSATPYGQTVTVYSSNGNTGTTDITCNAGTGTWSAPFNGNCAKPVEPCPGGGVTAWGNCVGAMPDTPKASGEQWTATNQQYGYTGAANLTCNNGVWTQDSATCDMVAAPPSCSNGWVGTVNFAQCTKKQAYAGEIQRCTVLGNCMPNHVMPPPGYGPENTYVVSGVVWVNCPGDPTPWFPFPPESQAVIDQGNFQTRQTYCVD